MSKAPSMPMLWDAYIADTTHLTTEEHGAYLLLLCSMWRREGWVPDDDRDNARITGLSVGKWRKCKERLRPMLIFEGGQISQKKLNRTWQETQDKIEKNRLNGAKGGRPLSNKNKRLSKAAGFQIENPDQTIPEPEPDLKREAKASEKRGCVIPDDWMPDFEFSDKVGLSRPMAVIEADKFRDYWIAATGAKARKKDWQATWRNWCRNALQRQNLLQSRCESGQKPHPRGSPASRETMSDILQRTFGDENGNNKNQDEAFTIDL